jgi:hypothetical protein
LAFAVDADFDFGLERSHRTDIWFRFEAELDEVESAMSV